jgi:hypothetical protein
MFTIQHAILHVFDFETGEPMLSRRELDMDSKAAKSFVQRHLRKISNSADSCHGEFTPESGFAGELEQYLEGRTGFIDLSCQIAQFLFDELRRADDPEQLDVLVADFEDDAKVDASKVKVDVAGAFDGGDAADFADAVDAAMQQAVSAAYEGHGDRYFALILFPRKKGFAHDLNADASGVAYASVQLNDNLLPNPTQKVDSYALVNTRTYEVSFSDKPRSIAGDQRYVLPDGLLQCTTHASAREVVREVTDIVSDVAGEYGSDSAVAMAVSRAKAYIAENAAVAESFSPDELGERVFEDEPAMRDRYEERARASELPERVHVRQSVATRMAGSHRIRTDTGIEITFPSSYTSNTDYIAFSKQPDGSINIEIRGIGHIENK